MPDRTRIAVVDEEPSWLASVGAMLLEDGLHALLIGDGATALEQIVRDEPVLVILSDVALAKALCERMADDPPALVLVTEDLDALDNETLAIFQAAYERPAPIPRIRAEVRMAVRGRRISGTVVKVHPSPALDDRKVG